MSGYVRRKIDVTFRIAQGPEDQPPKSFQSVKLSGLRCAVAVETQGLGNMPSAQIRVQGMTKSLMNQISTIGLLAARARRDFVRIEVGDDTNGMGLLYDGTIGEAWGDFSSMPDVSLLVQSYVGLRDAGLDVTPLTFNGPTDIVTIMSSLAAQLGYQFENNGVKGIILSSPYFPGSPRDQIKAAASAANIGWEIVLEGNKLVIWNKGAGRGTLVPLISPATGLIGYPGFTASGVTLNMRYNPNVVSQGTIKVESEIVPAQGTWIVRKVVHVVQSETPGGAWSTQCEAMRPGIIAAQQRE
jgi:hypothetical protein